MSPRSAETIGKLCAMVPEREVVMPKLDRADNVEDVTARLSDEVDSATTREAVRRQVCRHFLDFDNARVRDFVPLFVERRVRAELHR